MSLVGRIRKSWRGLSVQEHTHVFRQSILYITRAISAAEFRQALDDVHCKCRHFKTYRMGLTSHHYFYLPLRYFAIYTLSNRVDVVANQAYAKYGINRCDASMLVTLAQSTKMCGTMRRLRADKYADKTPIPENVRRRCQALLQFIASDIKHIVQRKLKFVTVFNGVSLDDLIGDVTARVVQQFYWAYERRDVKWMKLHALQVAHNYVTNLQYHYSSKKRSCASDRDSHGISYRLALSESSLPTGVTLDTLAGDCNDIDRTCSQMDVQRLFVMYGTTTKRRQLLELLSGVETPKFTEWLRTRRLLGKHDSHVDLQDSMPVSDYLRAATEWLGLKLDKARALMKRMRQALSKTNVVNFDAYRMLHRTGAPA